jgi:hypothetical protein
MHPALLIELRNGQLDSLLYLVGHGDRARTTRPAAETDKPELLLVPLGHYADPDFHASHADIPICWIGEHFECPQCELTLNAEHLEPAGLSRMIHLRGGVSGSEGAIVPAIHDDHVSE